MDDRLAAVLFGVRKNRILGVFAPFGSYRYLFLKGETFTSLNRCDLGRLNAIAFRNCVRIVL